MQQPQLRNPVTNLPGIPVRLPATLESRWRQSGLTVQWNALHAFQRRGWGGFLNLPPPDTLRVSESDQRVNFRTAKGYIPETTWNDIRAKGLTAAIHSQ